MRFRAAGGPLPVALLRENASDPARPGPGAASCGRAATAVCGAAAKNSPASGSTVTCSPRLHFFLSGFGTHLGGSGGCPDVYVGGGQPFAGRRSYSHPSVLAGRGAAPTPWERSRRLVSRVHLWGPEAFLRAFPSRLVGLSFSYYRESRSAAVYTRAGSLFARLAVSYSFSCCASILRATPARTAL